MLAIGCLLPFALAVVGAAVGGVMGGTAAGLWGGGAGLVLGGIAMLVLLRMLQRAKGGLSE